MGIERRGAGMTVSPHAFGDVLRQRRQAAGLTQEELAARAGLSVYSVSNLERGVAHAPRKDTVHLLARALQLSPENMAVFLAAAPPRLTRSASMRAGGLHVASVHLDLPSPITPLIGRAGEIAAVRAAIEERCARLVTLTGPSGMGKTRLALACAHALAPAFPDGARFIALAAAREAQEALSSIAHALRVTEQGAQTPSDAVVEALCDHELLLVLDNLEQIAHFPLALIDLLERCPGLCVVASSRTPLALRGEQLVDVPPLAVPSAIALSVEEIVQSDAVTLFVQRAQEGTAAFHLDEANAAVIAQICRQLDGLPLAIELAAARLRLLTPATLLARLEHRLAALASGYVDSPPRQQSLRAALEWSYELLPPSTQVVFCRLAVFAGGCMLDAAVAVCAGGGAAAEAADGAPPAETARAVEAELAQLREQGLAQRLEVPSAAGAPAEARLALLMTMREYAFERLVASGEQRAVAQAHAHYFLALAEAAETGVRGPEQARWLERLERERENLQAALQWLLEQRDRATGLRLAGALWHFWAARGELAEGRTWLDRMIALADEQESATPESTPASTPATAALDTRQWLAKALNGAGVLASRQSDYARALTLHERALGLRRALRDQVGVASSLNNLGGIAMEQAQYAQAQALWEESLALRRVLGDPRAIALALSNLGGLAHYRGENARAVALLEEALPLFVRAGDDLMRAMALNNLGAARHSLGETRVGWRRIEESLALARRLRSRRDEGRALNNLAHMAYQEGHNEEAVRRAEASLALHREVGDQWYQADDLALLGGIATDCGDVASAEAYLYEAFDLRQAIAHREGVADSLAHFGALARAQGQWNQARDDFREALCRYAEVESAVGAARCLEALAGALLGVEGTHAAERAIGLCGMAEALRHGEPALRSPSERMYHERLLACGRAAVGDRAWQAAWMAGAARAQAGLGAILVEVAEVAEVAEAPALV